MKLSRKFSNCYIVCSVVIAVLLISSARFLWSRKSSKHLEWTSSMVEDSSLGNTLIADSQYSECLPGGLPNTLPSLYNLYNNVETFVMFIGYPRSSHSLVGSILDAHPEIIIPHEYHIIEHWHVYKEEAIRNSNMQKYLLFYNLHSLSTWQATFGNRAPKPVFLYDGIYSYNVPGAWQGTFKRKLKIMGDKKGGGTTMELCEKPEKFADLKELNDSLGIPLKFLHVIRNPYDVISTWVLRLHNARLTANDREHKINSPGQLDHFIKSFFELVETNQRIRQIYGSESILDILSHELILKPRKTMDKICTFINVECDEGYLKQAENILFGKPSITRRAVVWSEEQKKRVLNEMSKYSFLESFSYDGNY